MQSGDSPPLPLLEPSDDDRVADAVADERIRVAAELRDGTLQALTGLSLQLASAVRRGGGDADELARLIADADHTLQDELRSLRMFVLELLEEADVRPSDAALGEQMTAMVSRIQRVWGLTVRLDRGEGLASIDARLAREVVRLAQEALVNASRYASAASASVQVHVTAGHVHLRIEQAGRGFAFQGALDNDDLFATRRGPVALKLRVRALGGRMRIQSFEDRAVIEMDIPTGDRA